MNIEDARKIERAPVKIGEQRTFYSTMQQEYEHGKRLRDYTGKLVTVVGQVVREDPDDELMFNVKAADGFLFVAYEGELDGFICDSGQFFWPDATWGHDHDPFA